MQVSNFSPFNSKKIGTLTQKQILSASKSSGFQQRNCGKINAFVFIQSFMLMLVNRNRSYQEWAICLSSLIKSTVSKQAVFNRMNQKFALTLKSLVKDVISYKIDKINKVGIFKPFKSVWIQDSTSIHLPDAAITLFKGNVANGKQKSVAKLNVVINLLSGSIPVMDWHNFSDNEQKLSTRKLPFIKKGDLLIRDLGYFVLSSFESLSMEGIYFLSRLPYGVNLYNPKSNQLLFLSRLLNRKKSIDIEVLCGKSKKIKVRLVALKLSAQQINERIRKAKNDRDLRLNHSKEYYKLLQYVIFITNVNKDTWNTKQVAQAYKSRWNIEILFKSWKSGMHIKDIIPDVKKNIYRVECVLYLLILYLSWFQQKIYVPLKWDKTVAKRGLSLIKLIKLFFMRPQLWFTKTKLNRETVNEITYFCSFEVRNDRTNSFNYCLS